MVSAIATGVSMTEAIPTSCPWEFAILAPDGSTLRWNHGCLGGTALFLDTVTLPTTGTYTVMLGGTGTGIGSATIQLFSVTNLGTTHYAWASGAVLHHNDARPGCALALHRL